MLQLAVAFALLQVTVVYSATPPVEHASRHHCRRLLQGRPQIGLFRALSSSSFESLTTTVDHAQKPFTRFSGSSKHPSPIDTPHCFHQNISHFDSSVDGTFCQRYWVDERYYKPGGPVYLLDGGETSGADRLPFLHNGILEILGNATGGLSIVLEHRYYGDSTPLPSFSTDDLRFLNNAEALEDSANFIRNFHRQFNFTFTSTSTTSSSLNATLLDPANTPWIYYGGSYAGARAAHMRVLYPDIVWGAIASSAVTHAQINFPQYFDPIQQYAPQECIAAIQSSVSVIDKVLDLPQPAPRLLKGLFGLSELEDDDFADVLQSPLGLWQAKNWDPAVGSDGFQRFCDALLDGKAGSKIGLIRLPAEVVNYAKYIKDNVVSQCPEEAGIVSCFGTHDDAQFLAHDKKQVWRLWLFQVCTQWGYFMPAPLDGPSILSKRLTLEYSSKICKQAFPPGRHFVVPEWPDVEEVNRRGDYAIQADRLAFIDGDRDPWRPMTPQAEDAPKRASTISRPRHVIFDGVHHYDENGLYDHNNEPERIKAVHAMEVEFMQAWLAEWEKKGTKQSPIKVMREG